MSVPVWRRSAFAGRAATTANDAGRERRLRACQQQNDLLAGFFTSTGMTLELEPPRSLAPWPFTGPQAGRSSPGSIG
jgi:hypothetical protein